MEYEDFITNYLDKNISIKINYWIAIPVMFNFIAIILWGIYFVIDLYFIFKLHVDSFILLIIKIELIKLVTKRRILKLCMEDEKYYEIFKHFIKIYNR